VWCENVTNDSVYGSLGYTEWRQGKNGFHSWGRNSLDPRTTPFYGLIEARQA